MKLILTDLFMKGSDATTLRNPFVIESNQCLMFRCQAINCGLLMAMVIMLVLHQPLDIRVNFIFFPPVFFIVIQTHNDHFIILKCLRYPIISNISS